MSLTPITQTITSVENIPDRSTMDQETFDLNAALFADQIQGLATDLGPWGDQANTLATAINVLVGILSGGTLGEVDFLRYLRSPGDIVWSSGTTPGVGTLVADGTAVSRTTYADLWNVYNAAGWTWETCTISTASPCVVSQASHGFTGGERLRFKSTGTLPTGISADSDYFVVAQDANNFKLSSDRMGTTLVNTTVSGTGTISFCQSLWGLGDGATTFNLPDLVDLFARGSSPSRAVGIYQPDAFRSHFHAIGEWASLPINNSNDHDIILSENTTAYHQGALNTLSQGGTETRPVNITLLPCVVY